MIDLVQHLTKAGSSVKLAAQIEALVREGRIPPESLLPPVRTVAKALNVSPGTAAAAYKALRAQGVVTSDRRRGTRVLPRPSQLEFTDTPAPPGALDLQIANPDPAFLPDLKKIFASIRPKSDRYGGTHLDPDLSARMRSNFEADGIDGSNLVVLSGAIAGIYRALRACCGPGDKVAVEDPGFNEHHASVRAQAMIPVPVAIDDVGMLPQSLAAALRSGARAGAREPFRPGDARQGVQDVLGASRSFADGARRSRHRRPRRDRSQRLDPRRRRGRRGSRPSRPRLLRPGRSALPLAISARHPRHHHRARAGAGDTPRGRIARSGRGAPHRTRTLNRDVTRCVGDNRPRFGANLPVGGSHRHEMAPRRRPPRCRLRDESATSATRQRRGRHRYRTDGQR